MLRLLLFAALNFGALGLGSWLMISPVKNVWYQNLNKAPWTPPGWVFGAAWFTIMACFSVYLWKLSSQFSFEKLKSFYMIFVLQWILNVIWNPIFFRWQMPGTGMAVILALTIVVAYITYYAFSKSGAWGTLLLPYFIWLLIACSLNGYILLKN